MQAAQPGQGPALRTDAGLGQGPGPESRHARSHSPWGGPTAGDPSREAERARRRPRRIDRWCSPAAAASLRAAVRARSRGRAVGNSAGCARSASWKRAPERGAAGRRQPGTPWAEGGQGRAGPGCRSAGHPRGRVPRRDALGLPGWAEAAERGGGGRGSRGAGRRASGRPPSRYPRGQGGSAPGPGGGGGGSGSPACSPARPVQVAWMARGEAGALVSPPGDPCPPGRPRLAAFIEHLCVAGAGAGCSRPEAGSLLSSSKAFQSLCIDLFIYKPWTLYYWAYICIHKS